MSPIEFWELLIVTIATLAFDLFTLYKPRKIHKFNQFFRDNFGVYYDDKKHTKENFSI